MAVAIKVTTGARPSKPKTISPEDIWNLVEDCWSQNADERPTTAVILQRLKRRIGETIEQSPPDWDDTYSAKFRRSIQEWPLLPSIAEIERRIPSNPMDVDDAFLVALENLELADITAVHRDDISWNDRIALLWPEETTPPTREPSALPPTPPSPTESVIGLPDDPEPTKIHPWLQPELPSFIHFDLATTAFAPLCRTRDEPAHRVLNTAEFRESAFRPPRTALRIVHPHIPFWPIDLAVPVGAAADSCSPITIGDVLANIYRAMHTRVTSEEWAFLDEEKQPAVTQAFAARCHAEAKHDYAQEVAIRMKVFFKGLMSVPTDPPGLVYLVTDNE
ncbi:hypothetical protein B0H14DRAFT_2959608 [Mycena olivaceomarginata]|nr:hypothetical protein B0H14DRAFT_2959608 [Mycena olivaceomarginata]